MAEKNKQDYTHLLILTLIVIFYFVNNYIWLSNDSVSSGDNTIYHLCGMIDYYGKILNLSWNLSIKKVILNLSSLLYVTDSYPGLVYFLASIANVLFGWSTLVTKLSNIIYVVVLLFSVYLLGAKYANRKTGLLAAFILLMYPGIYGLSRVFELDFALTAMVALSIYLLSNTGDFRNKKYSLFFGLSLGFGILTKVQFAIFIIGPLGYIFYKAFLKKITYLITHRRNFTRERRNIYILKLLSNRFYNFILSLFIGASISSFYWYGRLNIFLNNFRARIAGVNILKNEGIEVDLLSAAEGLKGLFFYFLETAFHISPFFILIFIMGVFAFFASRVVKEKLILLCWIIVPYIIFTMLPFKLGRYYFPSFPAIALISAIGIFELKNKKARNSLIFLIIAVSLMQFFRLSYGMKMLPDTSVKIKGRFQWAHPPRRDNYAQAVSEIIEEIEKKASGASYISIGIIGGEKKNSHLEHIEYTNFHDRELKRIEYFIRLRKPALRVYRGFSGKVLGFGQRINRNYMSIDFLIILEKNSEKSKEPIEYFKKYRILKEIVLSDESVIYLLKSPLFEINDETVIFPHIFRRKFNERLSFRDYELIFLSDGDYRVEVKFTKNEYQSVGEIYLDDQPIEIKMRKDSGLTKNKSGLEWHRLGIFTIVKGKHRLRLGGNLKDKIIGNIEAIKIRKVGNLY